MAETKTSTQSVRRYMEPRVPMIDTRNVHSSWFNHGRKENAGEDSDPFVLVSHDSSCGVLAAFDGMGGAGSAVRTLPDGSTHTDAYIASRFVRDCVIDFINRNKQYGIHFDENALAEFIKLRLDQKKEELNIVPSKLRSTMNRILPTTMAMMSWKTKGKGIEISSYWAGDSRNYIMCADGLYQASKDHARGGGDAMYNLHNDPPMSNTISQSEPFYISRLQFVSDSPVILISCTDGCFGYLKSPMHFEKLLLDTMYVSNSVSEWTNNLNEVLLPISGDDYSIAITMVGMSFGEWKLTMERRFKYLTKSFIVPFESYQKQLNEEIPEAMDSIWKAYSEGYSKLINIPEKENKES